MGHSIYCQAGIIVYLDVNGLFNKFNGRMDMISHTLAIECLGKTIKKTKRQKDDNTKY